MDMYRCLGRQLPMMMNTKLPNVEAGHASHEGLGSNGADLNRSVLVCFGNNRSRQWDIPTDLNPIGR